MIKRIRIIFILFVLLGLFSCSKFLNEITTIISTTNEVTTTTKAQTATMDLEIHYIDVGQADSIYIKLPNNQHMLIDAGNNSDGVLVVDYLLNQGVTTINYLIGTHPHEDHIGGLDDVINHFVIEHVYLPNKTSSTKTYDSVLKAISDKELSVTVAKEGIILFDVVLNGKTIKANMLSPISETYTDTNDYSPVIKLTYGNTSYLFTGDAEEVVEEEILEKGVDIEADVLKLGHHGSDSSTSQDFLDAVSPSIGIICVGKDNNYGHPSEEIIERLINNGVEIYRTDEAGTIIVKSNGDEILVETEKTIVNPNPGETTTTTENTLAFNLIINEVLPAPNSIFSQEWIELYNPTSEDIDISGFIIDDIEDGGTNPITIDQGTIIEANSYCVLYFTKMFNNSGDDVRLLSPQELVIDEFTYQDTEYDYSWYRINNLDWDDSQTENPTPNAFNRSDDNE